jgi:thiol-disulfide isomerase/thioredoxin
LWATWCTPCLAELPAMQKLRQHYQAENFDVVAVSVESQRPPAELVAFLRRNKLGGVAYYQDAHEDFQKALIFNALPTTYLIAPDGRILYQMTGTTDWYSPQMLKFLDAALKIY